MHGEYVYDSRIEVKHYKQNCANKNQVFETNGQEGTASESEASDTPKPVQQPMLTRINPIGPSHYHGVSGTPGHPNFPNFPNVACNQQGFQAYGSITYGINDGNRPFPDRGTSPVNPVWPPSNPPVHRGFDPHRHDRGGSRDRYQHPSGGHASTCDGTYCRPKYNQIRQPRTYAPMPRYWSEPCNWIRPRGPQRRTPSPNFNTTVQDGAVRRWNDKDRNSNSSRSVSPDQRADRISPYPDNGELELHLNNDMPIELQVTNLDQNIDPNQMKKLLYDLFTECCMVLQIGTFVQSDGNLAATIKVGALQDAQFAISRLHRARVGTKKILISYAHTSGPNPQVTRAQIVLVLQDVPGHRLPLFNFREMYEKRFSTSISISELYKLKDVCIISEDASGTGRMVSLSPDHRNTPSPFLNEGLPYCMIHVQKPANDMGWAEQEIASLPNVRMSLKVLEERVRRMLSSHRNSIPLPSFPSCYKAEFREPIPMDENGVPLEHLLSCLSIVELKPIGSSVKQVCWASKNEQSECLDESSRMINPALQNQMTLFSRELVDLLKTAPHCQLSFNRFIPAYHHHFGRQCRVADYGYTKLIELLEALDHTIQVMGEGTKRTVTLSHRAQVRRFTSDLLRVLKAQASKQVTLSEFPTVYQRVIGKAWDVTDYGVCDLEDILGEVSENTVVVSVHGDDRLIAIPKREQTAEEMEKTKMFAKEVVELLKHAPHQRMLFNKFVPSYHHHFGHQCRVSDYGFTKLIELFEAIPDTVKIEEVPGGERRISLTDSWGIRVLGEQISKLLSRIPGGQMKVANVGQVFSQEYGYMLHPESFHCQTIPQLLGRLDSIRVVNTRTGASIISIDTTNIETFGLECRRVLMEAGGYCMLVEKFKSKYEQIYHKDCPLDKFTSGLDNYISIFSSNNEGFVELTRIQQFACKVYKVLIHHGGKLYLSQFETAYKNLIGSACRPNQFGFANVISALKALQQCTVVIKELRQKRKTLITLNKKLAAVGIAIPSRFSEIHHDTDSSNESDTLEILPSSSFTTTINDWDSTNPLSASSGHFSMSRDRGDHGWPSMSSSQDSQKWGEDIHEELYENLENIASEFTPSSSKLESSYSLDNPDHDAWKSSIWSTSQYTFNQPETTNIVPELPGLTSYTGFPAVDHTSDLMSPMKGLLSATTNPLEPRISPYYASKGSVQAPHPSELPLPSTFTPKKNSFLNQTIDSKSSPLDMSNLSIDGTSERANSTPSKPSTGKRRLAAQFNQPVGES